MAYNGWKNWETWNVAAWCNNEEGIYRVRMAEKPLTADECEAFVREWFPDGTPDMRDWDVYEAREGVDWQEIADHWAEDYSEEAA